MYDVVALGELLIDMTNCGTSKQGNPVFEANPGGAPCNVLAMLSRLGKKTCFIGKVGDDQFGHHLQRALRECSISDAGLCIDPQIPTTLAFVHKLENNDRDFSFYRKPGADIMLSRSDINFNLIDNAKIFHFGSVSLTNSPVDQATKAAVNYALSHEKIVSFDPNLREPLWHDLQKAHAEIEWGIAHCHVLKISDNEIEWFTGIADQRAAADLLLSRFPNIALLLVSLGGNGSMAFSGGNTVFTAALPGITPIETTGAGDTFCACVLNYILENGLRPYAPEELNKMLTFANAAAGIVTTRIGALRVMPTLSEIRTALPHT